MHTDEYEISLGRELAVCEQYVRNYQKLLLGMEHTLGSGERERLEASLSRWRRTRDEYARLLGEMRQSATT